MELSGTTIIKRPADVVFAYVNDLSNDAYWRAQLDESGWRSDESFSPGTIGYSRVGSQEIEWRAITYIPCERIEWEYLNGPFRGRGGYYLVPVDGGTQFTMVADIEPIGRYRLLRPLFAWMVGRQNQADVEKLRDILESTTD